jgi:membrane fusion protein, adhesin transport system
MPETAAPQGMKPRTMLYLCVGACATFFLWAGLSRLDMVSMAMGEVVPQGKVKEVQHLEGGIIREILVREGEQVRSGQALINLESTGSGSSLEELGVRRNYLRVEIARLEAELEGRPEPEFEAELLECCPDAVAQARNLFLARGGRLASEMAAQRDEIKQRTQDIQENLAAIRNFEHSLSLTREQVQLSQELLDEQLTTRIKHLGLLQDEAKLASALEESRIGLTRAQSALSQAREKLGVLEGGRAEEARAKLSDARRELDELNQRMRRVSDSLDRTVIRSPVDGVVKALRLTTDGGVVAPGMIVADIVPADAGLLVEAKLPVSEIGFVRQGQEARVKLASRDARRFGHLEGKVVHVSPDRFATPDGHTFYTVRIQTEKDRFESGPEVYSLYPGMALMAFIHTGKRTVLAYLLDPFIDSVGSALQER